MDAPPLGKQLASNEKKVRDKAVKTLKTFLAGKNASLEIEEDTDWTEETVLDSRYSDLESQKLWKALYYCMWMSDKPLVQQTLANTLADLVLIVRPQESNSRVARFRTALAFLKAFWITILREWSGIDRHRMDKYYLLVRRYVTASLRLLARENWSVEAIKEYNALMSSENGPLCPINAKIPISIPVHYSQVFFSSLQDAMSSSESSPSSPILIAHLLQPFIFALAQAPQKAVCDTIFENIFDPVHEALSTQTSAAPPSKRRRTELSQPSAIQQVVQKATFCREDGTVIPIDEVDAVVLKALFVEASKEETRDSNRRRIYKFVREKEPEEGV